MIVRRKDRVIVLGITGRQGTFWTERMLAYGTSVVGGVNPKRAGETHAGVPIFGSATEAVASVGGDVAVLFIPPPMAKDAAVSAAEAGIRLLVVLRVRAGPPGRVTCTSIGAAGGSVPTGSADSIMR